MAQAATNHVSEATTALDEDNRGLDLTSGEAVKRGVRNLRHLNTLFLGALVVLGVVYTLYSTRAIAFPIALSCLIALPLRPVIRRLSRLGVPPPIGSGLLVFAGCGIMAAAVLALWSPANTWFAKSPAHFAAIEQKLKSLKQPIDEVRKAGEKVEGMTGGGDPSTLKVEVKQASLSNALLDTTGAVLAGAAIVITLVFLLLGFGDRVLEGVIKMLPTRRDKGNVRQMFYDAEHTISNYLLTYTGINIGLGIVIGLGMWGMGMPNPLLWGVMATCLNYLPFVGLAVGSIVVFLVALISFDSTAYALVAPGIYLLANGVEANVVTPVLLGRSLRLNVVAIFLFIIMWGWMWGIGGALIAVPLLAVLKVACDYSRPLKPLGTLLES